MPALVEHAKLSRERYHSVLSEILDVLRSADPLQTITALAAFGLTTPVDSDGVGGSWLNNDRFSQSHVELIQALALALPAENWSHTPPNPSQIQKLFDLLPVLADAFAHQRMAIMGQNRSDEHKAVTMVQELLRLHTQVVRNWGYFDDVLRICNELYSPLDIAFGERIGVSATCLIAAFHCLVRQSEKEMSNECVRLREVLGQGSAEGIIRKYYELNPQFKDNPDDMVALVVQRNAGVEGTKALVMAHWQFCLREIFEFSAASLGAALGLPEKQLKSALDRLSLAPGDLQSEKTEFLLLDNPVWCKPVIRLGGGRYFCAIPQVFFSFVHQTLERLASPYSALIDSVRQRRARFLEDQVKQVFEAAFPGADIVPGYRWREDGTEYENDLIVRIDSYLILVEAKSGSVSWPALRGAPARAKKHIEELFISPSVQSARLADRIKAVCTSPQLQNSLLPGLRLPFERIRTVLRYSVVLEDFATLQASMHVLRGTGWLPPDHSLSPCILLADLKVVFDVLEPMGQKVHYLRRRADLAGHSKIMGDELDYLGLYLGTGFNLGNTEFDETLRLQLVEMSKPIDEYCVARAEGIVRPKPQLRLTRWWADICAFVEKRRPEGWTEIICILLGLSIDEQDNAARMFEKSKVSVRNRRHHIGHDDSVVVVPHAKKSDAVALHAFCEEESGARRERMGSIAEQTFEHEHVQRCLVLAVNVDRDTYPYGSLAVAYREDSSTRAKEVVVY